MNIYRLNANTNPLYKSVRELYRSMEIVPYKFLPDHVQYRCMFGKCDIHILVCPENIVKKGGNLYVKPRDSCWQKIVDVPYVISNP